MNPQSGLKIRPCRAMTVRQNRERDTELLRLSRRDRNPTSRYVLCRVDERLWSCLCDLFFVAHSQSLTLLLTLTLTLALTLTLIHTPTRSRQVNHVLVATARMCSIHANHQRTCVH
eukprot:3753627-Pleurochrysis_carterae.AAC.1